MRSPAILSFAVFFGASFMRGQVAEPKTYGTTRVVVALQPASAFAAPASDVGWSFHDAGGSTSLYQSTPGSARWWEPVTIPDGTRVEVVELEGCDATATGQIVFGLRRSILDGGEDLLPLGGTGLSEAGGCTYYSATLDNPLTIDNSNFTYSTFVQWVGDFSPSCRIQAIRVYYYLQVRPAPAEATFNDVPTGHPLHQFVEALAYSGITAGCGSGLFCPDAPLTRGQMAVFLAKALGLQWP
jgi:hypothetical protein